MQHYYYPMIKRYIQSFSMIGPFDVLEEGQIRQWKRSYKGALGRRMTRLALMVGEVTRDCTFRREDSLIYATTYSETVSLEKFLGSFPTPSPLHFQNSIHAAGLAQIMISRQQAIGTVLPLAGEQMLVPDALRTAALSTVENAYLIGGEERSTWLVEQKQASASNFAFCMKIAMSDSDSSIGVLTLGREALPAQTQLENIPKLVEFAAHCDRKWDIRICHADLGLIQIKWHQ